MFNRNSVFVFWVLLMVAIAVVAGLSRSIIANESDISRLDALERQQAAFRVERSKQTTATDSRICTEVEGVKLQLRLDAERRYRELGRTLRVLKLEQTPEIERIARGNRDEVLKRFQKVNCGKLPSAKPPPPVGEED